MPISLEFGNREILAKQRTKWGCLKRGDAHITVTPGLSSNGGALDNEPVFKIPAEDNKQGFRRFTLCIYSLLFANH